MARDGDFKCPCQTIGVLIWRTMGIVERVSGIPLLATYGARTGDPLQSVSDNRGSAA